MEKPFTFYFIFFLSSVYSQVVVDFDSTFGINGKVEIKNYLYTSSFKLETLSDGTILVPINGSNGGIEHHQLHAYDVQGNIKNTFGNSGYIEVLSGVLNSSPSIEVSPNDKIFMYGQDKLDYSYIASITKDGQLDSMFGNNGYYLDSTGIINGLKILDNGKIHFFHYFDTNYSFRRILSNGNVDLSFANNGKLDLNHLNFKNFGPYVVLEDTSFIVLTSKISVFFDCLIKINSHGTLDNNFGVNGVVNLPLSDGNSEINSVYYNKNKIYITGTDTNQSSNHELLLLKYHLDGKLDTSLNHSGKLLLNINSFWDISHYLEFQSDEKIIISGTSANPDSGFGLNDVFVIRIFNNGKIDSSFNNSGLFWVNQDYNIQDFPTGLMLLDDGNLLGSIYSHTNSGYFPVIYKLQLGLFDSVDELNNKSEILVFPNPVKDLLTINSSEFTIELVNIFNIHGQLVHYQKVAQEKYVSIPLSPDLPNGVYIIKILHESGILTKRIIKHSE